MSPNLYKPHVYVIPEDDADRDIVNGFMLNLEINERQFYVDTVARGWERGRDKLLELCSGHLVKYTSAHAILIIDFDEQAQRASEIRDSVPDGLRDRVFIIGVFSEPEQLRRSTKKSYEQIGRMMAKGCKENNTDFWQKETLLAHNLEEIRRLSEAVHDLFFEC